MQSKMKRFINLLLVGVFWTISGSLAVADGPRGIPAFPGAEGAGALTPGGRGGQVIEVTNLNNSGPGSLRTAIKAAGPRIIVFRVGGTIELKDDLTIREPYVTIAGQTAPGDGIALKNYTLRISTHDVIVRYIRVRPGEGGDNAGNLVDGIEILNKPDNAKETDKMAHNIIIDHTSVSWAIDENVSVWNMRPDLSKIENVTIQWSIISEGLSHSRHPEDEHSKGLLVGSNNTHISIHHNLLIHNRKRNPVLHGVRIDMINNVI